jgi:hypothetical protein
MSFVSMLLIALFHPRKLKTVAAITCAGRVTLASQGEIGLLTRREVMSGTAWKIRTGLDEPQVFRLFKCAVKDEDTLVDAIVERLYRKMQDFDAMRAENTVELIVDRDAAAGSNFKALLDDLWPCRRASQLAA